MTWVPPGGLPRLSRTMFVDGATQVPAAQQSGNLLAPYSTLTAALAAIGQPADTADAEIGWRVYVAPGTYTENVAIPTNRSLEVIGGIATSGSFLKGVILNGTLAAALSSLVPKPAASAVVLSLHNVRVGGAFTLTDDNLAGTPTGQLLLLGETTNAAYLAGLLDGTGASTKWQTGSFVNAIAGAGINAPNMIIAPKENASFVGTLTCLRLGSSETVPARQSFFNSATIAVGAGTTSFIENCQFFQATVFSGGTSVKFDANSYASFVSAGAGGSVTAPMVLLVRGGARGGTRFGTDLTDADQTVSLDGTGASAGFTTGGNTYVGQAGVQTANRTTTLGTGGAKRGDRLRIVKRDVGGFTRALVNGGAGGGTLVTLPSGVQGFADAEFDGTNWGLVATGDALSLSSTAPVNVDKSAAAVGTATTAARSDHKHDVATATAVDISDATNSEGAATALARSDHVHAHGARGGGSLHALAVSGGAAGFLSGADKAKLDGIPVGAAPAALAWGADNIAITTTVRFLFPWYMDGLAQTTAIQMRAPRAGTLRVLRVRQNVAGTGAATITYTLRVNGVASALAVAMSNTVQDGSDLADSVTVAAGDLLDIHIAKSAIIVTSPTDITATVEYAA